MTAAAPPPTQCLGVVMVGCDGSPVGEAAMDYAVAEVNRRHARLVAVAAWEYPATVYGGGMSPVVLDYGPELAAGLEKMARTSLDVALQRAGNPVVEFDVIVREGRPSLVLLAASASADVLVIGARGSDM